MQDVSGAVLPLGLWGEPSLAFPPLLVIASNPWHFLAYSHITPISASIVTWHYLPCGFSLLISTQVKLL